MTNSRTPSRGTYYSRKPTPTKRNPAIGRILVVLLLIGAILLGIWGAKKLFGSDSPSPTPEVSPTPTVEASASSAPITTPTVKPDYQEMTLLSVGDVMYHEPQILAAKQADGSYDFTPSYRYVKDIISAADYAVANFETTLAGPQYPYRGWPAFNAPDAGLAALIDAGFDMALFANNHCYDTKQAGVTRTQEMFDEYNIDYIGARQSADEKSYRNVTVNGITLGLLNSTDDIAYGQLSPRTFNNVPVEDSAFNYMDTFNHSLLTEFYDQTAKRISELKSGGADLIVYYIHWGTEYQLEPNAMQKRIAAKLCDLGVDVIIGSHPHIVQGAEVLTSTADPEHQTLCFYSMGNFLSNQNRLTLDTTPNQEHTENGLMVQLTIRKYPDGKCTVTAVETIPTWVHRYPNSEIGMESHAIVPLEKALAEPAAYGLDNSSFGVEHATEAFRMTDATLGNIESVFAHE